MRLFTDILREIRKGRPVEEASHALADVVRAVDETGKPGSVTLTRAEHVRQAVFKQIVTEIAERTQCLTVFGTI